MHRRVWTLAAPMMVSNLSVPLVALVDSAVAGHLADAHMLGAVAVGSAIYGLPVWLCGFLRMGTIGFTAQAYGREDGSALRQVLVQALTMALLLALMANAIMRPLLAQIMALMKPSAELDAQAVGYLNVRLFGLPAALSNYALAGWFLGIHRPRATLAVMVLSNVGNVMLNLLLVLGLGMGVPGIALASVMGEWAGTALGLILLLAPLRRHAGAWALRGLRRWQSWRALITVNRDILLRTLALQGVFFAVTVLGSRLGDRVVAANALLLNGLMITAFAMDGLANAIEALTGQALGRGDSGSLRRALVVAGGWSLIGSLLFAAGFAVAGHLFVDMQTDIASVRTTAYAYLPYLAVLPLVAVWSYLFDGLFVGATRARDMRNGMQAAALVFIAVALALHGLGNHGLWLAFLAFMAARGAVMAWLARRIHARGGFASIGA
ncbi:MATE family efflux transporter [Oleiagrimonas sp. C23AA]|uniref:MATE family efflux transporter n=1 Tax=Oleiagrimonas sp. C23AA TaxID=2719047 RepID=UPI001F10F647|nr:MATE family efflux transporter [Oleiagrimonas sp. C23AA]